jgi:excisionase family DNA binding protein
MLRSEHGRSQSYGASTVGGPPAARSEAGPSPAGPSPRVLKEGRSPSPAARQAGHGARHGVLQPSDKPGRNRRQVDSTSSALLTLREAAAYLAVSYWTVRSWVEVGKLPSVRLPGDGRLVRVERAALDALIAASRMSAS